MDKIKQLQKKGVKIPFPQMVFIADEVNIENIEPGVTIHPGVRITGDKTLLGAGSELGKEHGGMYTNVCCGRNVILGSGHYNNSVFLDNVEIRSGAEMRKGTLFMEHARAAHTVGCKMTVVGMYATLGSLVNFCDIYISGGSDKPYAFTEIGSGAVHYNFTPQGLKFGSLIGPGVGGEMCGISPRVFVGGQTQIVAPCHIGSGSLIPAGVAIREKVAANTMAVSEPIKPGHKPYYRELITNVRQKLLLTTELILHYTLLEHYFRKVRCGYAQHHNDFFLENLYTAAANAIHSNISERTKWLFEKIEKGTAIHLTAKLADSLAIHNKLQSANWKKKAAFHNQNVHEHHAIIHTQELLYSKVKSFAQLDISLPTFSFDKPSFSECITNLDIDTQKQIRHLWQSTIRQQQQNLQTIIEKAIPEVENNSIVNDYLETMRRKQQLIVHFEQRKSNLGIVNDAKEYSNREIDVTLGTNSKEIMHYLTSLHKPMVVDWKLLQDFATSTSDWKSFVDKSLFRLHGTDGIRGNVHYLDAHAPHDEAIVRYIELGDLTPQLCCLLAYASIRAFETIYKTTAVVGVGKDTRDLYCNDPLRSDCLYTALQRGIATAGHTIYDLGTMPIANVPYILASQTPPQNPINIILYKSASHNPASQDGLKIFIRDEQGRFVKAMSDMENVITALMFYHAHDIQPSTTLDVQCLQEQAQKIFTEVVTATHNLPGKTAQNVELICDLSHGALSATPYKKALELAIRECGIHSITWVGDAPDGLNINNNSGDDRVGAGHFENIEQITRTDIEPGGKYNGFPALKKLFTYKDKPQTTAFAIFMDGDGDRGITAVYNPNSDIAHIFDGDKSLFLQIRSAVDKKALSPGTVIAFTVDSSIPFMNAMKNCVQQLHPVDFVMNEDCSSDKVNLCITPIGDKYILQQQSLGGEKSGHIIRCNRVMAQDQQHDVYVGNGFLANIHTVFSILDLLATQRDFSQISSLYPTPKSISVYVYFVKKELWYYQSPLWQKIVACIQQNFSDYTLLQTKFTQEPDTLFFCSSQNDNFEFSITARPSGTENKMGVKFSGTAHNIDTFTKVSEEIFFVLAHEMKNTNLSAMQMENEVLHLLTQQKQSIVDIQETLIPEDNPIERAQFFAVVEALAKQKLVSYDGKSIALSARGQKYLGEL